MKKFLALFAVMALIVFAAPAFAANPFMDVPAGHWAYDAVDQLAARGIINGYPDGSYKGGQPATRYEMAMVVARALGGMDGASGRDIDLLKKLVLEFKNELDALGVKVNELDKRVALLEDGVGGWKIRGIFRFDAKFGSSDSDDYPFSAGKENQFTKERFRLFLTKDIDENTYFYAQYRAGGGGRTGMGDTTNGYWSHLYVDTRMPWDINMRVGRFFVNFEDDYGLYIDDDALFYSGRVDGFRLQKDFGALSVTGVVARNANYGPDVQGFTLAYDSASQYMTYILNLHFAPGEKFFAGALGYWFQEDSDVSVALGDGSTYGLYAGYNFKPGIGLKGVYYHQDLDILNDSSNAWKAILDINQEVLKFTSLWLEYSQEGNDFYGISGRYAFMGNDFAGWNRPLNTETSKYIFVYAKQNWSSRFSTFVRYTHADFGTTGIANANEWGIGIGHQYSPAIYFELAYDQVDHGDSAGNDRLGKESVVRFRTSVNF